MTNLSRAIGRAAIGAPAVTNCRAEARNSRRRRTYRWGMTLSGGRSRWLAGRQRGTPKQSTTTLQPSWMRTLCERTLK